MTAYAVQSVCCLKVSPDSNQPIQPGHQRPSVAFALLLPVSSNRKIAHRQAPKRALERKVKLSKRLPVKLLGLEIGRLKEGVDWATLKNMKISLGLVENYFASEETLDISSLLPAGNA